MARRIVRAIRSGPNPGRFLRKDATSGRWQEVDDRETAWKASQALREKTRWASMMKKKKDAAAGGEEGSNTLDSTTTALALGDAIMMKEVVESATTNAAKKTKKRSSFIDTAEQAEEAESKVGDNSNGGANPNNLTKMAKCEHNSNTRSVVELNAPTEASHIAVPPVATLGGNKSESIDYLHPHTNNNDYITTTTYIIPKDEDVLFGRGGRTNHHPGNVRLREIVDQYRPIYAGKSQHTPAHPQGRDGRFTYLLSKSLYMLLNCCSSVSLLSYLHCFTEAKKIDKPSVSKLIVGALRNANPPSRFLRLNEETSRWEDVGDRRAAEKVSQTLREKDRGDSKASANNNGSSKPSADTTSEAITSDGKEGHSKVPSPPDETVEVPYLEEGETILLLGQESNRCRR